MASIIEGIESLIESIGHDKTLEKRKISVHDPKKRILKKRKRVLKRKRIFDRFDVEGYEEYLHELQHIPSIDIERAENFYEAGFESPEAIVESGLLDLAEFTDIDYKNTRTVWEESKALVEGSKERKEGSPEEGSIQEPEDDTRKSLYQISKEELMEELEELEKNMDDEIERLPSYDELDRRVDEL